MRGRVGLLAGVVVVVLGVWLAGAGAAWGGTVTPMCTTDQDGQLPCKAGWYTTPVLLSWVWSPIAGSAPTPGCETEYPYSGDANAIVSCVVNWPSPPGVSYQYPIQVELSNPTAAAVPSRSSDANGWYNHPVAVAFQGSAFSGIASCTSTTYAGPDTPTATVTGSCTDNAGKIATASFTFPYAATPPSLQIAADPGDSIVDLHWQASAGIASLASIRIVRSPGLRGKKSSTIYRGNAGAFNDTRVRDGVHYRYTFTAQDQAGNVTARDVTATPNPRLLSPAPGAHLSTPPMLLWTPKPGASYYNVQLYRDGGKVLSIWPAHAKLQLKRTWSFAGRHYRLKPGRYRWYVWPGFGPRAAGRYGALIGSGTFVVTRPK